MRRPTLAESVNWRTHTLGLGHLLVDFECGNCLSYVRNANSIRSSFPHSHLNPDLQYVAASCLACATLNILAVTDRFGHTVGYHVFTYNL